MNKVKYIRNKSSVGPDVHVVEIYTTDSSNRLISREESTDINDCINSAYITPEQVAWVIEQANR
mgnify:CR=1 FL=1